jgi:hypothetical protein
VAEKSHYHPTPCPALWGEKGRGILAAHLCKNLLNKNVSYTLIIIKSKRKNMFFVEKSLKQIFFGNILRGIFGFLLVPLHCSREDLG